LKIQASEQGFARLSSYKKYQKEAKKDE